MTHALETMNCRTPVRTVESGVLSWSWKGWTQSFTHDGMSLFLDGFAIIDGGDHVKKADDSTDHGAIEIIELYKQKGVQFIDSLRGSFAIALWDGANRKLILGTDHFGTRPIYYGEFNGRFAFALRVGSFAAVPEISLSIDFNSIYFYLNHSFIPAPFTIYQNVRRLEPGHILIRTNGQVNVKRYWDMAYDEDTDLTEAAAANRLCSSLSDSVRFALDTAGSDREERGAFLSGGTDSSTIVGLLSQLGGQPVKSFSVGFDESAYNEIHYARVAAKHFKSEAHEYFVRADEALEVIPKLATAYDEPFGNSSAIPTYFCLKMAREAGVKVMFAGDGGDELFGGNERYVTEQSFAIFKNIPGAVRFAIETGAEVIPWRKVQRYVHKANQSAVDRFFSYQLHIRNHADDFLSEDFIHSIDREFPLDIPRRHYAQAGSCAPLNRLLYIDLKLAIADNDLFKVNRTAEVHGIHVRYPFLDPHVGALSGKIPANLKVKGWSKRYIFKKAFEDFLPREILSKKKHGFGLPTGDWLRNHHGFRDLARSLLLEPRSLQRGYFKRPALEQLLRDHDKERSSYYGSYIWYFMMLELWHRHHVDRGSMQQLKGL